MWNFEVCCGMENPIPPNISDNSSIIVASPRGQAKLAHNVVMRNLKGLWNVGHFVNMDSFFYKETLF